MGLIKTNLRANNMIRLDNCTLRLAVSQSENIFQVCLHGNSENWKFIISWEITFCRLLYSSLVTCLLWSSAVFAPLNHLRGLYHRLLYYAIPGMSSKFSKTVTNKSALLVRWLGGKKKNKKAHSNQKKSVIWCLHNSFPCPSLKKEGSNRNTGSPLKSLKRQYGFSYERMEKWEP